MFKPLKPFPEASHFVFVCVCVCVCMCVCMAHRTPYGLQKSPLLNPIFVSQKLEFQQESFHSQNLSHENESRKLEFRQETCDTAKFVHPAEIHFFRFFSWLLQISTSFPFSPKELHWTKACYNTKYTCCNTNATRISTAFHWPTSGLPVECVLVPCGSLAFQKQEENC
jgi:hypothetical protein